MVISAAPTVTAASRADLEADLKAASTSNAASRAGSAGVLVVGALARPLRRAERSDAAEPHRVCPALPGNEPS